MVELEVVLWAYFVFVVVVFVVLVQCRKMMMKKNLKKKKKKSLQECLGLVVLLLALHEHESVGPVCEVLMSQALFPVVECCQTHPLVVVRQLAYGLQFSPQQQLVWLLSLHTWIQSCCFDSTGWPLVGYRMFGFPGMWPYVSVLGRL